MAEKKGNNPSGSWEGVSDNLTKIKEWLDFESGTREDDPVYEHHR